MRTEPAKESYLAARVFSLCCALPLSAVAFLTLRTQSALPNFNIMGSAFALSITTAAALCWWFAGFGHLARSRVVILFSFGGAGIVGGISFVAGFYGPIVLMPTASEGPLLGIFVTGPFGFVAGAVIGLIVGCVREFRQTTGEL